MKAFAAIVGAALAALAARTAVRRLRNGKAKSDGAWKLDESFAHANHSVHVRSTRSVSELQDAIIERWVAFTNALDREVLQSGAEVRLDIKVPDAGIELCIEPSDA